jgi:hypothetical protein
MSSQSSSPVAAEPNSLLESSLFSFHHYSGLQQKMIPDDANCGGVVRDDVIVTEGETALQPTEDNNGQMEVDAAHEDDGQDTSQVATVAQFDNELKEIDSSATSDDYQQHNSGKPMSAAKVENLKYQMKYLLNRHRLLVERDVYEVRRR